MPIILDVFPRDPANGYHADITRTVFRGARRGGCARCTTPCATPTRGHRPGEGGEKASEVHKACVDLFKERGFETGPTKKGGMQGFFHGTGHGLGLAVHELPRVGAVEEPLPEGRS